MSPVRFDPSFVTVQQPYIVSHIVGCSFVIQLTLTLQMTTAQVVETSVTVNNSPIQDYVHLEDHVPPTYEGLKYPIGTFAILARQYFAGFLQRVLNFAI